ncbi:disulfide isomerase DsbC N-terminal domain-containing protein, partial [Salmonella enterica]|uniref:disulfide isomerase DsbC N-terminal domain-containing protein n=1 Tax=Salmonella enterica TaxID=28901 RepID=UPI00398C6BD6
LAAVFSGLARAECWTFRHSLARQGGQKPELPASQLAGMKTVLTHSGVLYVTVDGKHIIHGPMYDVSGAHPVNVTNKLLMSQPNALEQEMLVYNAPDAKHCIPVVTYITSGYLPKLPEELKDYTTRPHTARYPVFPPHA